MTIRHAFYIVLVPTLGLLSPMSYGKNPSNLAAVTSAVEEVNDLRTTLVHALPPGGKVDETTFAKVCKPVGARAQAIGQERGWAFVQMSDKFRNPKHKADAEGEAALTAFRSDAKLQGFWTTSNVGDKIQHRYFRRIVVDQPCLACHGDKDARPAFIKAKYPDDRAFGFAVGDLRGIYAVTWTE